MAVVASAHGIRERKMTNTTEEASRGGKRAARRNRPRDNKKVQVSKAMTYILRHGAEKEGVAMDSKGFVAVTDLLAYRKLASNRVTEAQVRQLVAECPKQRFFLEERPEGLYIRANQGHSLKDVEVEMEPVTDASKVPIAVHGTYHTAWRKIARTGLSRMNRQHIHIATGEFSSDQVISGMRNTAQVLVYVDVAKALADGIPFFRSKNDVILTAGIDGMLPPKYFAQVLDAKTREVLFTNADTQ